MFGYLCNLVCIAFELSFDHLLSFVMSQLRNRSRLHFEKYLILLTSSNYLKGSHNQEDNVDSFSPIQTSSDL